MTERVKYQDIGGRVYERENETPAVVPTQWFRYTAAKDFMIESAGFKKGTVIGIGTASMRVPVVLSKFQQSPKVKGFNINLGHVHARLMSETLDAEKIDTPPDADTIGVGNPDDWDG